MRISPPFLPALVLALSLPLSAQEGAKVSKKRLPANASKAVRIVADVPYADSENPRQRLDLYLPTRPKAEKLPVIVFIHGGAWLQGDKRTGRRRLQPFVESGEYAGVSANYRLSQEASWPAQIHDVKAAIRWIRSEAATTYHLDPDRIATWGTSAGGHLVSMLGVAGDVKTLEGTVGKHLGVSSRVTCVANFFAPSSLLTMDDVPSDIVHNAPDSPESRLVGGPIQERREAALSASPVTHASSGDAPFLHVHGDQDRLVPHDQSVQFDRALDRAGVPSFLITVTGGGHGGFKQPEVSTLLKNFFNKHLLRTSHSLSDQEIP